MMNSSLDHLPQNKQRELARVFDILHEEFAVALSGSSTDWKKKGRILKIVLFGSYARGGWVDEPHTMKGYRSDFDLLIIVNNRKLTDFASYWNKAADRLIREPSIKTPVSFIVYSRREVNSYLREGQYFFADIRQDGIVLYELDDQPLAEPQPLTPQDAHATAKGHFEKRFSLSRTFTKGFRFYFSEKDYHVAVFELHQTIENAYSCVLLTLTNYGPPSHNIKFLRSLAEEQDRRLAQAWPRDQRPYTSWFNTLNEAYVKACYSKHYQISEEPLIWFGERTEILHELVEEICAEHLAKLAAAAKTFEKSADK